MKLKSIQFLRAIAAILVVYVHSVDLQMKFSHSRQQSFFYLQNFGAIGVDLFFVISGFIITYVAHKYSGTADAFIFFVKRFLRVNPIYYITSLIFFCIVLLQGWINHTMGLMSSDKILGSISDTILILPSSGQMLLYNPLLLIGWTLSFEWWFYILFFFLIITKTKHKPLFIGVLLAGLVSVGYLIKIKDYRYVFFTNPIIIEFLFGVFICWLFLRIKTVSNYIPIAAVLLGLISYIVLIIYGFGSISEMYVILSGRLSMLRVLLWGIPSSLLVAGCIFMEKNKQLNRLWNNKWIQLTGDASYSIYLVHLAIFSLLTIMYKKTGFLLNPDLAVFLQLAIAVLAAIVFFKLVERPLLRITKNIAVDKPSEISISKSLETAPIH